MRLGQYLHAIRRRAVPYDRALDTMDPPSLPFGGLGLSSPPAEGDHVRELQEALAALDLGLELPVDGVYGPRTAEAAYQARRQLGLDIPAGTEDRAPPDLLEALGLTRGD